MQYTYTKSGQVGTLSYQEKDDTIRTYTYNYAKDQSPVKNTFPDLSYINWSYDSLRRNTKIIHTPKEGASDAKKLYTVLKYKEAEYTTAEDKTKKSQTTLVEHYANKFGADGEAVSAYDYVYDAWGNITQIKETGLNTEVFYYDDIVRIGDVTIGDEPTGDGILTGEAAKDESGTTEADRYKVGNTIKNPERTYIYNDLGEVVSASETYKNRKTTEYVYTYDEGGNIVTETIDGTVHTYTYDATWKDQLIAYDGKEITYDVFGCPLNYMGKAVTWDIYGGLTSVDNGSDTITYTYMGDGQRRSKTVNGKTTTYHYNQVEFFFIECKFYLCYNF